MSGPRRDDTGQAMGLVAHQHTGPSLWSRSSGGLPFETKGNETKEGNRGGVHVCWNAGLDLAPWSNLAYPLDLGPCSQEPPGLTYCVGSQVKRGINAQLLCSNTTEWYLLKFWLKFGEARPQSGMARAGQCAPAVGANYVTCRE